jgi:succinate-acetate transporter protein
MLTCMIREMAVGNTFGATALSSYGGFWLSFAIILTPGGFEIASTLQKEGGETAFLNSFGLFLMGWFIFTTILLLCTLRSTVAFFFLFFTLDMAFLLLGIGYLQNDGAHPQSGCIVAGGAFGLMAAFAAWYNALAGIADSSNRYVPLIPSCWIGRWMSANTCEIASSSFPSRISPGLTRAVKGAARSTTRRRGRTRPRRTMFQRRLHSDLFIE